MPPDLGPHGVPNAPARSTASSSRGTASPRVRSVLVGQRIRGQVAVIDVPAGPRRAGVYRRGARRRLPGRARGPGGRVLRARRGGRHARHPRLAWDSRRGRGRVAASRAGPGRGRPVTTLRRSRGGSDPTVSVGGQCVIEHTTDARAVDVTVRRFRPGYPAHANDSGGLTWTSTPSAPTRISAGPSRRTRSYSPLTRSPRRARCARRRSTVRWPPAASGPSALGVEAPIAFASTTCGRGSRAARSSPCLAPRHSTSRPGRKPRAGHRVARPRGRPGSGRRLH